MGKKNEIVQIESKILVWARTRINMSIPDVAKKLKINSEIIERWENGLDLPTLAQLEKLAYKVYKIPLAVFFLPEPPREPPINQQFRTIPEKEIIQLPTELMLSVKEGQYFQEILKELFNGKNPVQNPIFRKFNVLSRNNLKSIAKEIRNIINVDRFIQSKFKDSTDAFKYYRNQVEKNGIFVFQQTLKDYCRGYSLYDDEFPIIVINSSENSDTGKNFTIFHELSHILYKMGGLTNEFTYQSQNSIEVQCNSLASNILIDDEDLLKNDLITSIKTIEWDEEILRHLAKVHKVSKEVILRKLLDLDLTTQAYYSKKRNEWLASYSKKRESSGMDYYQSKLSKLGNNFASIVLGNLYSGRIDSYQASEYLGLKINQIQQIERLVFK
jgi:Zn-dependent peptidase ImmA (M78 family)/transcriptional regulator with XRE-family HTH domain